MHPTPRIALPVSHTVTIVASHPTLVDQTVATGTVTFKPQPGREYIPDGELVDGTWKLWITDKATDAVASEPVTIAARKAAPIKGPDVGPYVVQTLTQ